MSPPRETLADLHRRFDGPIPDDLRDQALTGASVALPTPRQRASRDIDLLALASVQSLAGWRTAVATIDVIHRGRREATIARLASALRSYRDAGVALHRRC